MNLIEKKCPNCGASLSFNDNDKSCKCEYCKRAFEIERDETANTNTLSDEFNLNEVKGPLKIIGLYFAGTYIVGAIIAIIVFILVGVVGYNIYKIASSQLNEMDEEEKMEQAKDKYYTDVSQLSNDDFEDIDNDSIFKISSNGEGVNNTSHFYTRDGDPKREKIYVASKKDGNMIIAIYKANYKDSIHQENRYTVYVPIVYENILNNDDLNKFENPQVKAPEYYFNSDHSSYTYGYGSFEEAYNSVVKPLENDYKISEK